MQKYPKAGKSDKKFDPLGVLVKNSFNGLPNDKAFISQYYNIGNSARWLATGFLVD